jgi:hypothetical protein
MLPHVKNRVFEFNIIDLKLLPIFLLQLFGDTLRRLVAHNINFYNPTFSLLEGSTKDFKN